MSPKQSLSLLKEFGVNPAQNNNFTAESTAFPDPYSGQFSKTDASAMSHMIKGSLDFGELKSGEGSGFGASPGFQSESDKQRQTSPRSPVGRRDKKPAD